jgi:hypothetical protein
MMRYVVELMEGGDAMRVVAKEILRFAFPIMLGSSVGGVPLEGGDAMRCEEEMRGGGGGGGCNVM